MLDPDQREPGHRWIGEVLNDLRIYAAEHHLKITEDLLGATIAGLLHDLDSNQQSTLSRNVPNKSPRFPKDNVVNLTGCRCS